MLPRIFLFTLLNALSFSFIGCSSHELGANSTEKEALVREVFSGWQANKNEFPFSNFGLQVDQSLSYSTLLVSPELVVPLSESLVVLLTKAGPPDAGHSSPAMLSAYWFLLKNGRWILNKRQDEVAWLGSSGNFETVHAKPFTKGVMGIFVEHGWAGMGTNSRWLTPFRLDDQKMSFLLKSPNDTLTLYQLDENVQWYDCEAWLNQPIGHQKSMKVLDSQHGISDRCFRVKASWDVAPRGTNQYPDIELLQHKRKVSVTQRSSKEVNEGHDTETKYTLKLLGQTSKLVLRYDSKKEIFKVIKGIELEEPL